MGTIKIDGIAYTIPQEFNLAESLDEHSGTYRISLGDVNIPIQEYEKAFTALDSKTKGLFIETLEFQEGNQVLKMTLATIDKYVKPFGIFYDIESNIKDTRLIVIKDTTNDRNRRKSTSTNKKIDGKRKDTDKRNKRISRA